MAENVKFETIKSEEVTFGTNNFLEIARKKAITDEGENEFISISRGFTTPEGEKRFRKSITIPNEKDVIKKVAASLAKI